MTNPIIELQAKTISLLNGDVEDETLLIRTELIKMNQLGLITTESQPYKIQEYNISQNFANDQNFENPNFIWIQRPYVNGFFSKSTVSKLVTNLLLLSGDIIISETRYYSNKEPELYVYGDQPDDYNNLIKGLYPMAVISRTNGLWEHVNGYSGNMINPNIDYLEDLPEETQVSIKNRCSLINIWSRIFSQTLFGVVVEALYLCYNENMNALMEI